MSDHDRPDQQVWELQEPTDELPDVGLDWLVRNTEALRKNGKPHLPAISQVTGISLSAIYAILPARRDQRDFRIPDGRTIGRIAFVGAHVNDTTPEVAHSKIFRLRVPNGAVAELEQRLAELEMAVAA